MFERFARALIRSHSFEMSYINTDQAIPSSRTRLFALENGAEGDCA
jgi:hypothetical protein